MSATATEPASMASLERSDKTGLTDSTHTSTSSTSSEKYSLDECDDKPILLYTYRGDLRTSSQKDLCAWLDENENFDKHRVTKKPIPRYTSYIDVKRHDLYLPEEKSFYEKFPNYDSSLASVKVPSLQYWSRMFWGNYDQLFIVSPESTPSSSTASGSRNTSPIGTWGLDSQLDARLGMLKEREEVGE